MSTPYLNPYLAPYKPLSNITPFTYKDGLTYLEVLEELRKYVNDDLVDFINTNFTELGDDFETQVNTLIEAVNNAIQSVIEGSAETQDSVVAENIDNPATLTRAALDALYANQVTQAAIAAIVVAGATKTALDAAYAGQVTNAIIAGIVTAAGATKTALDAAYAGQVTNAAIAAIVTAAGATKTALDAAYGGQVTDAAVAALVVEGTDTGNAVVALVPPVTLESPDESMTVAVTDSYLGFIAGDIMDDGTGILLMQLAPGFFSPYIISALGMSIVANGAGTGHQIAFNPTVGSIQLIPTGGSGLSNTAATMTFNGVKIPAFTTVNLPNAADAGIPNGTMVFDLTEGVVKITHNDAWVTVGAAGGIGEINAFEGIIIGNDAAILGDYNSIVIGNFSKAGNDANVVVGIDSRVEENGYGNVVIGNITAIGIDTEPAYDNGVAIGAGAAVQKVGGGTGGIAIGAFSVVSDSESVAIGANTQANGNKSIALGDSAIVEADNAAMIGDGTNSAEGVARFGYDKLNFANGSAQLEVSATDSNSLVYNGWIISGLYIIDSIPPVGDDLAIGTMAWEFTMGKPLWLKTIETDPLDNVWVDATGTTVYPLP